MPNLSRRQFIGCAVSGAAVIYGAPCSIALGPMSEAEVLLKFRAAMPEGWDFHVVNGQKVFPLREFHGDPPNRKYVSAYSLKGTKDNGEKFCPGVWFSQDKSREAVIADIAKARAMMVGINNGTFRWGRIE